MNFCFMYFKAPMLLHLELYLLSELALYHYEMSISISGNTSCLEVYFVINTPLPDFLGLLHLFPSFFFPFSRHFTFKVHFLTTLELTISKSSLMVSAFYVEHLAHYYLHNYGCIWVYVYHLVMWFLFVLSDFISFFMHTSQWVKYFLYFIFIILLAF